MKKIRILAIIPNRDDATSFYRAIGPLTELTRRESINVEIAEPSKVTWAVIAANCDILFMQRPYNQEQILISKMAKMQGKPIWVDYDDDLFNVPISNPAHRIYSKDEIKKNIATLIASADHVTVSTQAIYDSLQTLPSGPLAKKCTIIRNALPMHILPECVPLEQKRNKLVCWRGSATHNEDIEIYLNDILKCVEEFTDHTFYFQGDVPWRLKQYEGKFKNLVFQPSVDIIEYFQIIGTTQPKIMLVPLADNKFNKAKSDIARIEGLWAGAVCVAPNTTEWVGPGSFNYYPGKLYEELKNALSLNDDELNKIVQSTRDGWLKTRTVNETNTLRESVIMDLISNA